MEDTYIPAIRSGRFLGLYDPLLRWTMRERTFKRRLIEEARLRSPQRILDLGCGTATLTLLVKRICPGAEVMGLDGDMQILNYAKAKALKAGGGVQLHQGFAQALPYPDASFDHVFSSLVFHHLTRDMKMQTLQEVFRVLRPGGELHVADWGRPQNWLMRHAFRLVEWSDGKERTADHRAGRLPQFMESAGFARARVTQQYMTLFGTLCHYHAQKPA